MFGLRMIGQFEAPRVWKAFNFQVTRSRGGRPSGDSNSWSPRVPSFYSLNRTSCAKGVTCYFESVPGSSISFTCLGNNWNHSTVDKSSFKILLDDKIWLPTLAGKGTTKVPQCRYHASTLTSIPLSTYSSSLDPLDVSAASVERTLKDAKSFPSFLTDNFDGQHTYLRIPIT